MTPREDVTRLGTIHVHEDGTTTIETNGKHIDAQEFEDKYYPSTRATQVLAQLVVQPITQAVIWLGPGPLWVRALVALALIVPLAKATVDVRWWLWRRRHPPGERWLDAARRAAPWN